MELSRTRELNVSLAGSSFSKAVEFPLHESIRELRTGYESVSECLEQSLAECDLRAAELVDCRQQLMTANRNLADQEHRLAERARTEADAQSRCAALQQRVDAMQSQLGELQLLASGAQAEAAQSQQRLEIQIEHNGQLHAQMTRFESEGEVSRSELAQLRAQFGPLAESASDAARLRGELASAEAELARLRDQTASVPADADLREQLTAAEAEREHMESELELLRNRGAELSEALAEQTRTIADEREQWNEELRQLRRAVERQAELLARGPSDSPDNAQAPAADPPRTRPSQSGHGDGVVVDSLLEQFALLQKDKVRKRAGVSG
jgi:chromosome segregation ATPase